MEEGGSPSDTALAQAVPSSGSTQCLSWHRVPLNRHMVTAFEKEGTEALGLLLSHARRT